MDYENNRNTLGGKGEKIIIVFDYVSNDIPDVNKTMESEFKILTGGGMAKITFR